MSSAEGPTVGPFVQREKLNELYITRKLRRPPAASLQNEQGTGPHGPRADFKCALVWLQLLLVVSAGWSERAVMGRLKGGANNRAEAEELTLRQLDGLINTAEWRYAGDGLNSALRKDAFKRLIWLEAERERLHGVPAPKRRKPRRLSS